MRPRRHAAVAASFNQDCVLVQDFESIFPGVPFKIVFQQYRPNSDIARLARLRSDLCSKSSADPNQYASVCRGDALFFSMGENMRRRDFIIIIAGSASPCHPRCWRAPTR